MGGGGGGAGGGPPPRLALSLVSARPVRWLLILAGGLAVVTWPQVVCVTAVVAVLWWSRRRFRSRMARQFLLPVSETIASPIGARFRLMLSSEFVKPARQPRPLSPAEERIRAWYGSRVEPAVRWLPNKVTLARQAAARRLAPLARLVELLRRPKPAVAARLTIERPYLTPDQRGFIESVMSAKVTLPTCHVRWDQHGSKVVATWTLTKPPPRRVGYEQLMEQWPKLGPDEFYLGESGAGPVTVSLHDDSPHICLSAGSGAGKSVLAQTVATQVLARGGEVVILDRKGSHRWARDLAGVTYCRVPAQMHDELVRVAALADSRNQRALDEDDDWDPGHRVLVVCEELNATIGQLADYWQRVRERGEPRQSPAITAFRELLYMGRSARVNVLAIAQMLTARAVGGPESRENFAVRCLARYTSNAWRMLCPETPQPRPTRQLGRWQIVVAGTATETQVCFLSPAQSRELAGRSGRRVPADRKRSDRAPTRDVSGDALAVGDIGDAAGGPVDPLSDRMTLRDAVAEGVLPWSHQATKKRLQRSRNRPTPVGRRGLADLFTRADLIEWAERESSRAAGGGAATGDRPDR